MKYKFITITTLEDEKIFLTYDMIEKTWGIKKNQLKQNLINLTQKNMFKEFLECETEDMELYAAILNRNIEKIYKLIIKGED